MSEKKARSWRISAGTCQRLKDFCKKKGYHMEMVVEEAIMRYLIEEKARDRK